MGFDARPLARVASGGELSRVMLALKTVLAALDTGSAFEGMGASREVQFAALAEPAMLLGLAALAALTRQLSLSGIYGRLTLSALPGSGPPVLLLVGEQ